MIVSASKKTLQTIAVISLLAILASALLLGWQLWQTREYVPVKATLTEIRKTIDRGDSYSNTTNVIKYYRYEYQTQGRDCEYTTRSLLGFLHREGSTKTLRISPENPEVVRDLFAMECCVLAAAFFGIFLWFSLTAIKSKYGS